eukprot:TRINITY_DN2226_c0_g1_i1.p2 TRINITY_DN2226_c0_g1~~TRINITY_DN2226_c0_g1_i1.p2  ORF type:complete len:183 (-),score=57.78 TRINITY_DN2226_c0_g1_i1:159-707(-)
MCFDFCFVSPSLVLVSRSRVCFFFFFFQAEDGIRDVERSRGLGDVYKRQYQRRVHGHQKFGAPGDAPKTMRIDYHIGIMQHFSEWVCPEHSGWVRAKFESWWRNRSKTPPPKTAEEAVKLASDGALAMPRKIVVKSTAGEKFDKVIDYELSAIPDYTLEPYWGDPYSGEFDSYDDPDEEVPF